MPKTGLSWFTMPRPKPNAALRLFCFPFAGGGSTAFHAWPAHLTEEVDLFAAVLPGRLQRFAEPPYERIEPLVEELTRAVAPLLDHPFALFGHSMGALIAFELARELARTGRIPDRLFLSGCGAPHLKFPLAFSGLPDDQFLKAVASLNGMPEQVLADVEFQRIILPALRADFTLTEAYRYEPGPPLSCPIVVYSAVDDTAVNPGSLESWSLHTSSTCSVRILLGNHSLSSCEQAILADLCREMAYVARCSTYPVRVMS
jgi:medium-chain acyl-[acyl-carrier-protein] hydrolase